MSRDNLQNVERVKMIVQAVLLSLTETYDKVDIGKLKVQQIEKLLVSIQQHDEPIRSSFYHELLSAVNQTPALVIEMNTIFAQLSPEIQKNIAVAQLKRYITERQSYNSLYRGRSILKLFGVDQTAYTTETKIKTALNLIDCIRNNTTTINFDKHHKVAMHDGQLGRIYAQYQHLFETPSPASGPSCSSR